MQTNQKDRTEWVDVAKGAAIILVVFGHTWRGLFNAELVDGNLFEAIDSRIYAFHMPVFFLLSGYFYISVIARFTMPNYLKRIVVRILWPMVLWTYIFLIAKLIAGQMSNSPVSFADLLRFPIPGQVHFWFLWALFVISILLFPLRFALQDGKIPQAVLWAVGIVTLVLWVAALPWQLHYWTSGALQNLPFFYLGIILANQDVGRHITRRIAFGAAILFLLLISCWPLFDQTILQYFVSILLAACFVATIAGLSNKRDFIGKSILLWFGQASLVIYVAHTMFSAAFREVMTFGGIENVLLHSVVGTAIGIIGPLFILAATKLTRTKRIFGL